MRFTSCALVVTLLTGCASTRFVSTWKAPDAKPLQVNGTKVAAVVMMRQQTSRRLGEEALAREITSMGAVGVPMYKFLDEAREDNEATARKMMEKEGIQGVVVMRPVDVDKETVITPAMYSRPMYGGFWGGYYRYGWGRPWGPMVSPATVRTDVTVSVETLIYSLSQNKLLWAGTSKTTNPSGIDRFVQDLSKAAAKELRKAGLMTP